MVVDRYEGRGIFLLVKTSNPSSGELQEIMSAYGFDSESEYISFFPIETLNTLLVISSKKEIFRELDFWVEKMDREAQFEEQQIFLYQVENTTADSISSTLGQIFGYQSGGMSRGGGSAASQRRTTSPTGNPQDQNNRTQQQQQRQQQQRTQNTQQQGDLSNTPGAQAAANMVIDYANNALIFNTTPREFYKIRKILRKLDPHLLECPVILVQL